MRGGLKEITNEELNHVIDKLSKCSPPVILTPII